MSGLGRPSGSNSLDKRDSYARRGMKADWEFDCVSFFALHTDCGCFVRKNRLRVKDWVLPVSQSKRDLHLVLVYLLNVCLGWDTQICSRLSIR